MNMSLRTALAVVGLALAVIAASADPWTPALAGVLRPPTTAGAAGFWEAQPASEPVPVLADSPEPGRPGGTDGPALRGAGRWTWPIQPRPVVVRPFQAPPAPWASGHRGVDLAAAPGTLIRAPADGVIAFRGVVVGRGVVSIDHGGALRSTYEPVDATVREGQPVRRGEVIGSLAWTPGHCAPAACLHWGAIRAGRYLDPLPWVRPPPVLLPLR